MSGTGSGVTLPFQRLVLTPHNSTIFPLPLSHQMDASSKWSMLPKPRRRVGPLLGLDVRMELCWESRRLCRTRCWFLRRIGEYIRLIYMLDLQLRGFKLMLINLLMLREKKLTSIEISITLKFQEGLLTSDLRISLLGNLPETYFCLSCSGEVHNYTLYWYLRPFGASALLASYDDVYGPELYLIEPVGTGFVCLPV